MSRSRSYPRLFIMKLFSTVYYSGGIQAPGSYDSQVNSFFLLLLYTHTKREREKKQGEEISVENKSLMGLSFIITTILSKIHFCLF